MGEMSVAEAAERLGVSPVRVRQRLAAGSLAGRRIGGRWVISAAEMEKARNPAGARPLSKRMAWAVLDVLSDRAPDISPSEAVRARRYAVRLLAEQQPARLMRAWFKDRADRRLFRIAPSDLADLAQDSRVHPSGVSAPSSGIVAQGLFEGYMQAAELPDVQGDFYLVDADLPDFNVVLHVVDRLHELSRASVAADLAEHAGAREDGRVVELLEALP